MDEQGREALLQLAVALTDEPRAAADLLAVGAGPTRNTGEDDDPYALASAALLRQHLRTRRGGRSRPRTRPQSVDGEEALPLSPRQQELRVVQTELAALGALSRAVVVLRYLEHRTLAEIGRLVERSPAAVQRTLDGAEAALRRAPYLLEQALEALPRPEPGQLEAADQRWRAARRRRRGRVLLAGVLVVVLAVAATVLPPLLRPDPYARAYGEWVYSLQLVPGADVQVEGRLLSPGEEVIELTRAGDAATCSVTVTSAAGPVEVPAGRAARLGDRPARFVPSTPSSGAGLWWQLGPRTSALAQCDGTADDAALLALAGQVRHGPSVAQLPFDFGLLPPGEEVQTVFDYNDGIGAVVAPRGDSEESPDSLVVFFDDGEAVLDPAGRRVDVRGATGRLTVDEDETALCWRSSDRKVCVGAINQSRIGARRQPRVTARVVSTARAVRLAPDLADRSTWFAAGDVIPR